MFVVLAIKFKMRLMTSFKLLRSERFYLESPKGKVREVECLLNPWSLIVRFRFRGKRIKLSSQDAPSGISQLLPAEAARPGLPPFFGNTHLAKRAAPSLLAARCPRSLSANHAAPAPSAIIALADDIKTHDVVFDGQRLETGLPPQAPVEPATLKPRIGLEGQGDHIPIRVARRRGHPELTSIEQCGGRSDGIGFVGRAQDTTPNDLDPLASAATPTRWTDKAIYRADDQRVGQWSDEVRLMVGG